MGYRERRAHKAQQKQESLGQAYSGEQRVPMPTPNQMNSRDNPNNLPQSDAVVLEDFYGIDGGLASTRRPRPVVYTSGSANLPLYGVISYDASGTASAELFLFKRSDAIGNATTIYRAGEKIKAGVTTTTASVAFSGSTSANVVVGVDAVEFNKNLIAVNGSKALHWTRASAWDYWSATASGGNINDFWGISSFKNRLYGWEEDDTKFWYGSTDQVLGTFNSFELGGLINGSIVSLAHMTRDGGAGPDDYAAFITTEGEVVVYQGTDPGAADDWSLVGKYKIGKPIGRKSHVNYGNQVVVLCQDDFYFLPNDLQGKRQSTKGVGFRASQNTNVNSGVNGVHWEKEGLLVFSDGSYLDVKNNFAYGNISLLNIPPNELREGDSVGANFGAAQVASNVAVFIDRLFSFATAIPDADTVGTNTLFEINSPIRLGNNEVPPLHAGRIRTAPINTPNNTIIHLVNPVFKARPYYASDTYKSASAPSNLNIKYRVAVVYDKENDPYYSASANAWTTVTASGDTTGLWTSGFGDGDTAQIYIDLMTATCEGDIFLQRIDVTLGDTGGL